MKQKKAIIFFSAGLGDAVLLIPLVKRLKQQGFSVSGFFNSVHPCEEIFTEINLLDQIIVRKTKSQQILHSIRHLFTYDKAFVNYFASNRINTLLSGLLAKNIYTNRKADSFLTGLFQSKIKYIKPANGIHDGQQNVNLLQDNYEIFLTDFFVDFPLSKRSSHLPNTFIAVQISTGNNKVTYKNWPIAYWTDFLKRLSEQFPQKKIVLLGDANETGLSEKITAWAPDITSLIGKTSISEAMNVLAQSELFIGLDGGLMHLAVALKKPTFTIWGPSSSILYGYEKFSPRHQCISLHLACNPCSAWINANHAKARNPESCPDHACLQQLMPSEVFNRFKQYVNSLSVYAE